MIFRWLCFPQVVQKQTLGEVKNGMIVQWPICVTLTNNIWFWQNFTSTISGIFKGARCDAPPLGPTILFIARCPGGQFFFTGHSVYYLVTFSRSQDNKGKSIRSAILLIATCWKCTYWKLLKTFISPWRQQHKTYIQKQTQRTQNKT